MEIDDPEISLRGKVTKQEKQLNLLSSHRLDNPNTTVNELVKKATQNEQILKRYQQFELQLLDVSGFEALLRMLLQDSVNYFQLDAAELWLYDPQQTLSELLPDEIESIAGLAVMTSSSPFKALYGDSPKVQLVSISEHPTLPVLKGRSVRSVALLPLVRHGVIVGSLHFGAKGHQRFAADKSTDFIAHLSSIIAVCFENAINEERLRRLSMYDMLTQVKNRRAFHQSLENEVSRAARSGDPLSLLFIDLDFFKRINDNYGHQIGDKVLKEVAQFMHGMLRKTDHVCRYGGEEFALILPVCGQQRAMEVAERIRQQASELIIVNEEGDTIKLTLSVGVSCWLPMDNKESEQVIADRLLSCSDQAVYRAKDNGRNCVEYLD
jgi:diguanylate cyclase (GGDEF)-like protein